MKTLELNYHYDAGHGWLKVPITLLLDLDIVHRISPYSYRDRFYAYLEEDCDMSFFLETCKANDIETVIAEINDGDHSNIRNMLSF